MGDLSKISADKMAEALAALVKRMDETFTEWQEFSNSVAKRRKLNSAEKERRAYIHGKLAGLHQALVEFEKRAPIEFRGSGEAERGQQ